MQKTPPSFSADNFLKFMGNMGNLTEKDARYLAKKLKEDERDAVADALKKKSESAQALPTEASKVLCNAFNIQ